MKTFLKYLSVAALLLAVIPAFAFAAAPGANKIYPPGYYPGKGPPAGTPPNAPVPGYEQKQPGDKAAGAVAETPGMKVTLRGRNSKSGTAVISVSLRNVTQKPVTIKNEFMSAPMRNSSYVRVFVDQRETAGVEMFRKKMLIKSSEETITLNPNQERTVVELEFYNLPAGSHTVYAAYTSQIANYERKRFNWWTGSASSNMISVRVAQPDVDKQIVAAGNKMMKNILADLKKLSSQYGELKGIAMANVKRGTGMYPGVSQLVFSGKSGTRVTVQVRGSEEELAPYPDFDMKYQYIGVSVVCFVENMKNPVLRNAVFKVVRDNAPVFNDVVKSVSAKKAMEVMPVSQNLLNLVDSADLVVQALVLEAKTEIQENLSQQWVLTVKLRKTLKGRSKDEVVTVFTDSPVIRFKGSFVNKQFIMFLDLKYRNPVTYELLGAEPVSAATVATIEQRVETLKKKK